MNERMNEFKIMPERYITKQRLCKKLKSDGRADIYYLRPKGAAG